MFGNREICGSAMRHRRVTEWPVSGR
jgi:hypothetical protein